MTVDELVSFRNFINTYLRMISYHENYIDSKSISRREEASKVLEFMLPRLRAITIFYVKKFCNEPAIASNNAFLSSLRVDILNKVREHIDVPLPKTYAKILKATKK